MTNTTNNISKNVGKYVELKRQISRLETEAKILEAELVKHAEELLADTKYKSIRLPGADSTCAVTATNAETLKLTYPSLLREIFGGVYGDVVKEETTYTVNAHGKRLLLSILTGSYNESATLAGLIGNLKVDEKTRKLLSKKLKGISFDKDKENLKTLCGFDDATASDYSYLAMEAAAWENIANLLEISYGVASPAHLMSLQMKTMQAAAADQTVKVSVTDLEG